MICRKCGAEIEGSVKFCGKCGAAISFEPPVQEKSIAEEIDSNSENKNKTRGKLAIIGVCSVILLFVVGFFAYRSIFGMSAKNQLARLDSDVNTLNESYAALYGKVDFYDNGFDSVPSVNNKPVIDDNILGSVFNVEIKQNEDAAATLGKVFMGYATVNDLLAENDVKNSDGFYTRVVKQNTYYICFGYESRPSKMGFKYVDESDKSFTGFKLTGEEPVAMLLAFHYLGTVDEKSFDTINGIMSYSRFLDYCLGYDVDSDEEPSEYDVFLSDCATVNMLLKEAKNTYLANIKTTRWAGKSIDDSTLCVGDVLDENNIPYDNSFFSRTIDGKTYKMVVVYMNGLDSEMLNISLDNSDEAKDRICAPLTDKIKISELSGISPLSVMESDCATVNMLLHEVTNTYLADIETTIWNGKSIKDSTLSVGDVLTENGIDYTQYFKREIQGTTYQMMIKYNESNSGSDDFFIVVEKSTYDMMIDDSVPLTSSLCISKIAESVKEVRNISSKNVASKNN